MGIDLAGFHKLYNTAPYLGYGADSMVASAIVRSPYCCIASMMETAYQVEEFVNHHLLLLEVHAIADLIQAHT